MALLLTLAAVLGDYAAGPFIQFPILYLVPVAFTAWYLERGWALGLAVLLPLVRLGFVLASDVPWEEIYSAVNALIRILVLSAVALLTHALAGQMRSLEQEVRVLRGILPICTFCKKIREDTGEWKPLEQVITARSEAWFSHGWCEECGREHYGDLAEE